MSEVAVKSAGFPPAPPASRSSKSKKKKGGGSGGSDGGVNGQGENTGRWTAEEHRLFLQGLEQHGKGWKKIASLIKSRTVVQIRTHAQKYFQKLAKARQNGEEGEVIMEGRGGLSTTAGHDLVGGGGLPPPTKRRRPPLAGTKRKAIQSIVHSAQKQGKKMAVEGKPLPLPAVAPALANFVVRDKAGFAANGTLTSSALEDSLFRFLTPAPVSTTDSPVLNDVARQAGANPITLPSENPSSAPTNGDGEVSPTCVADINIYPSWTDGKDPPAWYAKGADVDALLDVAGTLDWLADPGDLNESYNPPHIESSPNMPEIDVSPTKITPQVHNYDEDEGVQYHHPDHHPDEYHQPEGEELLHDTNSEDENHHHHDEDADVTEHHLATISSSAELPQTMDDSNMDQVVPPLPSIFDGAPEAEEHYGDIHHDDHAASEEHHGIGAEEHHHHSETVEAPAPSTSHHSATDLLLSSSHPSNAKLSLKEDVPAEHESHHAADAGELGEATLFDSEMEHDFVSTILENSESAVDLAALHED
uniref:Uncharacterized protein n=1 Tax=Amphora coffeiformis TaxID=265554 RepID=A0A6S8P3T4_9STRA|mmetsp:Transcript_14660/g.27834  ORF Transcript_14660/g.27834 Transcript_14660/m.27834 type:complete len:532 (+) Transcript_14660:249-1844(+)